MYGLLLENLATFIKAQWGEGKWESVRRHAGIDLVAFSIHHVYPETLMRRIARSAFQVLGVDERQFFKAMGVYFVQYVSQYGYDQLLSVLGRHLRDFLNGLDNLHEYLKFSYPKMRAPSFYCDDETESGLKLHYRSKRRGFVYYVMGQIKQVAKQFYNQECNIHLITEEVVGETIHVVFELAFDNSAFSEAEELRTLIGKDLRLPVRASTLFELFPFCIVFNSEMEITHTGHTLMTILKDLVGQVMTEAFDMTRPLIPFCFSAIMQRRNNIFELITVAPIHDVNQFFGAIDSIDDEKESEGTRLRLRGQMLYMEDWNMMLYLANPVMPDLNGLVDCSLFINDLSLHDCSRDLVLAGTQQSVELKLALDQEQQKSRKLVQSMKKLDEEMKRTDELLYQMIPKQVADRIRKGENPVETCQTFDSVSILFTDVVNFTDICSQITPLQVVSMLNHMYFLFDQLSERNGVYKVETVGDSYMVVSGAPVPNINHAERICDMAMDIIDASEAIEDPSGRENGLRVRVGCHSGAVVAGVVGIKMPRYCLFGDTVNTASRMESTAEPGKIQISEACKNLLPSLYTFELRGTINVKGKGEMYTFWLLGREARVPLSKYYSKTIIWTAPTAKLLDGIGRGCGPIVEDTHNKHVDRTDSILSVASPSLSGPTAYKNQRSAAAFKNTSLRMKPQLQFKFTSNSTSASGDPIRAGGGSTQSAHTMSSPELKKMSKVGNRRSFEDFVSDDNIQVYFNKNIEAKRREASASFQEKIKHNKIQPTSVYDSDLIKEAFKSPLGGKPKCEKTPPPSPGKVCNEKILSAEVLAEATMIIAGILPDAQSKKSQSPHDKKAMQNIPTGVGEGLLTEYIIEVEKRLQERLHGLRQDAPPASNMSLSKVGKVKRGPPAPPSTMTSLSEIDATQSSDMSSKSDEQDSICDSPITIGSGQTQLLRPIPITEAFNPDTTSNERSNRKIDDIRKKPKYGEPIPYTSHLDEVNIKPGATTAKSVVRKGSHSKRELDDLTILSMPFDQNTTPCPQIKPSDSIFTFANKEHCLSSLIDLCLFDKQAITSTDKSYCSDPATGSNKPAGRVPPVKTQPDIERSSSFESKEHEMENLNSGSLKITSKDNKFTEPNKPPLTRVPPVKTKEGENPDSGELGKHLVQKRSEQMTKKPVPVQLTSSDDDEDFVKFKPLSRPPPVKTTTERDGSSSMSGFDKKHQDIIKKKLSESKKPLSYIQEDYEFKPLPVQIIPEEDAIEQLFKKSPYRPLFIKSKQEEDNKFEDDRKPRPVAHIFEKRDFIFKPIKDACNITYTEKSDRSHCPAKQKPIMSVVDEKTKKRPETVEEVEEPTPNDENDTVGSPAVLIGNKLAEVKVEKWIREEFAEAKQPSIENDDSDSSTDHYAQACDEKWIQDVLTDDGDEKWIKDDFPEDPSKDEESQPKILGVLESFLEDSLTPSNPRQSPFKQSASAARKDSPKPETIPRISDSPKWKVEVKTISSSIKSDEPKPSSPEPKQKDGTITVNSEKEVSETPKTTPKPEDAPNKGGKMDKVEEDKEILKSETVAEETTAEEKGTNPKDSTRVMDDKPRVNFGTFQQSSSFSKMDTPLQTKKIATPCRHRVMELASTWENKVIDRSWRMTHSEGNPEFHHVIIPGHSESSLKTLPQSKKKPLVRTLSEFVDENQGTSDKDKNSGGASTSQTSSHSSYRVFSSEFGTIPNLSPDEFVKTINKNCTKFCYDCLSIPGSMVDNDSDIFFEHPFDMDMGREPKTPRVEKSPKISNAPKKKKIFKLFNRISDADNTKPQQNDGKGTVPKY